ncbi:MAG: HNH endonuclease, partial [bacterium]
MALSTEILTSEVLVLNKLWQVVSVCSVKRALCLLYLRHAQVVLKEGGSFYTFGFEDWRDFSQNHSQDSEIIRTVAYKIRMPQVILLLIYDRFPPRRVKFTRKNIYKRDENIC